MDNENKNPLPFASYDQLIQEPNAVSLHVPGLLPLLLPRYRQYPVVKPNVKLLLSITKSILNIKNILRLHVILQIWN